MENKKESCQYLVKCSCNKEVLVHATSEEEAINMAKKFPSVKHHPFCKKLFKVMEVIKKEKNK